MAKVGQFLVAIDRELARRRLENDEKLGRFFFKGPRGEMIPRVSVRLADFLGRHELRGNTRELDSLLEAAIARSAGDRIEGFPEGTSLRSVQPSIPVPGGPVESGPVPSAPVATPPSTDRSAGRSRGEEVVLTPEGVTATLKSVGGNVSAAARKLGAERTRLIRFMRTHGIQGD